jgi:acetylornithine deacetylase/succinyl-diaminopimelate desuccinylase-like protein
MGRITAVALAALALACAPAPAPIEPPPRTPEAPGLGQRAADILSQAIRIVTVNPPGDEMPLATYFVALLQGAGLEAAVIETPSGDSTIGRAAAWGLLRGKGGGKPIVLLSHLDVVPAEAGAWSSDPFTGQIVNRAVVGRGAIDAKGASVVQLLTLTELARRGTTLDRDVIFLATPDEETGGQDGAGWIARERPDLLRDAAYLLTEGGGMSPGDGRSRSIWGIAVTEKNPCWLRIVAHGSPGHSSVPPRDAAVPRLVADDLPVLSSSRVIAESTSSQRSEGSSPSVIAVRQTSVVIVNPGGTGRPNPVISTNPAPVPPSRSGSDPSAWANSYRCGKKESPWS